MKSDFFSFDQVFQKMDRLKRRSRLSSPKMRACNVLPRWNRWVDPRCKRKVAWRQSNVHDKARYNPPRRARGKSPQRSRSWSLLTFQFHRPHCHRRVSHGKLLRPSLPSSHFKSFRRDARLIWIFPRLHCHFCNQKAGWDEEGNNLYQEG